MKDFINTIFTTIGASIFVILVFIVAALAILKIGDWYDNWSYRREKRKNNVRNEKSCLPDEGTQEWEELCRWSDEWYDSYHRMKDIDASSRFKFSLKEFWKKWRPW